MMNKTQYVLSALCGEKGIGKKKMQKLVYLLTRKGLDLGLRYSIHYYGPYSAELNRQVYALQSQGALSINAQKKTHIITAAQNERKNPLNQDESQILDDILRNFGQLSALDLEVLTTADYVANSVLNPPDCTKSNIVCEVQQIKGSKFDVTVIEGCIESLCENGYLKIAH